MRILVRKELNMDKPINLRLLSPSEKIKAGFVTQIQQTNMYKRNKQRNDEMKYIELMQKDENLKTYLLAILYRELNQNTSLASKNKICESVIISVAQKYEDSLKRLFPNLFGETGETNKDFLSYEIERVEENNDIRKAFKEMPYLLRCSKKSI
jgi:hypothetical protein